MARSTNDKMLRMKPAKKFTTNVAICADSALVNIKLVRYVKVMMAGPKKIMRAQVMLYRSPSEKASVNISSVSCDS